MSLPLLFLGRPEDREFIFLVTEEFPNITEDFAALCLFRIWQDFAIQGDRIRSVPYTSEARAGSSTVRVLEDYCGWKRAGGVTGRMVDLAIASGFLKLVPAGEDLANLVPVEFARIQGKGAGQGGSEVMPWIKGTRRKARLDSEKFAVGAVDETLDLFRRNENPILSDLPEERLRHATQLIFQLCRIMKWQRPVDATWTRELLQRADHICTRHGQAAINDRLEWLVGNRDTDEIPPRIDLFLSAWDTLPAL